MRYGAKLTVAAAGLCSAVWAVLLFGLGNIGLQQSVSIGPQVLVTDYPAVTALGFAVATIGAAVLGPVLRLTVRGAVLFLGLTLAIIVIMSWLVTPSLIGELEFEHGHWVFPVLAVLGLLPLGVVLGAVVPAAWRARRSAARP